MFLPNIGNLEVNMIVKKSGLSSKSYQMKKVDFDQRNNSCPLVTIIVLPTIQSLLKNIRCLLGTT